MREINNTLANAVTLILQAVQLQKETETAKGNIETAEISKLKRNVSDLEDILSDKNKVRKLRLIIM